MAESSNFPNNLAQFIDCTEEKTGLCAKLLTELTGAEVKTDDLITSWRVDNRYYSADVTIQTLSVGHVIEITNPEALVFLYESESDGFSKIRQIWESFSDVCSPSVCLVVGAYLGELEEESFEEATKWCVEHGFELVEWNYENEDSSTAEDDDDLDRQGVARISDALQAHMWPDMTMKNKKDTGEQKANGSVSSGTNGNVTVPIEEMTPEQILSRGLNNQGDPVSDNITGEESFEELFGRFAQMKTHAESLPRDERKDYAEKVVKAFWQAIGGDEDELEDSD